LDINKNSSTIVSAWDTDTITLSSVTDTIELSSLQYSDVNYGDMSTVSNGGYTIGGATGATGNYTFSNTMPNTVWTTSTTNPFVNGNITWGSSSAHVEQGGKMSLQGDNADLDINGKSLVKWMAAMEERLNWMQPNVELEKDWDELRRLGERYRKLEKKCQQKAQMWEALKKLPKPKL